MGRRVGVERVREQTSEPFFHNQWQVGNFLPQKPLKAVVEMFLHLYRNENRFWAKAPRTFEPFCYLLSSAKAKISWKIQPNTRLVTCARVLQLKYFPRAKLGTQGMEVTRLLHRPPWSLLLHSIPAHCATGSTDAVLFDAGVEAGARLLGVDGRLPAPARRRGRRRCGRACLPPRCHLLRHLRAPSTTRYSSPKSLLSPSFLPIPHSRLAAATWYRHDMLKPLMPA
jgi:hypothetical protein